MRRHFYDSLDQRGLIQGQRFEFSRPGVCSLKAFEENGPGPGQVLVETVVTVVSPGTERAVYQCVDTVEAAYPFVPGYCHAGRVVMTGSACRVQVGQLVATSASHSSLAVCSDADVFLIPPKVAPEHAALTQLGFTAIQGVRRTGIEPGERVAVLGAGLVGILAAQAARVAGGDVVVVATSAPRLRVAAACGLATLETRGERASLEALAADVVIEATGNPAAIQDACAAATQGGRIALLGSPRGTCRAFDPTVPLLRSLTVIGAHIWAVPKTDLSPRALPRVREAELFLDLVARGRILVEPLITRRAAPDEAAQVYADLATPEDKSVGIVFDWTLPGPWRSRIERPSPLRGVGRLVLKAAGRALPRPAPRTEGRADSRCLRFGLIGCGEIAAESARALRANANCTVAFTADPNLEAARGLAAATDARYSARIEDLLGSSDVDAVLISTPHNLHAPLAIQAAEAGKHVVVEKPMATRVADCDRMIAAAERAGVSLSVCYCHRNDPRVSRAKQLLAAGVVGDPIGTRIVFGQPRSREYWRAGLSGRSRSDWRGRRESAGGGVLIMNACHILDYMSWLVGSDVIEVAACTGTLSQAVEVEDSVSLSYRYANGALGSLDATTSLIGPDTFEQVIRGTEGQLIVAPSLRFWSRRTIEGYESQRWHSVKDLPRSEERRIFFEAFANAVLDDGTPPVEARQARAVQATIEAAYLSSERRAVISVASL